MKRNILLLIFFLIETAVVVAGTGRYTVSATLAAKPGMQSTMARTRTVASTLLHVFFMKNPSNRFGAALKSVPFFVVTL